MDTTTYCAARGARQQHERQFRSSRCFNLVHRCSATSVTGLLLTVLQQQYIFYDRGRHFQVTRVLVTDTHWLLWASFLLHPTGCSWSVSIPQVYSAYSRPPVHGHNCTTVQVEAVLFPTPAMPSMANDMGSRIKDNCGNVGHNERCGWILSTAHMVGIDFFRCVRLLSRR